MDDVVIRVNHVSKDFVLPHERITSIKSAFTHLYTLTRYRKANETQHALKDISLEIKKGEFFGIVGRNGSGKSTLLKILAGIYQPTKGKIYIHGKLVPFIELGVGFNPELTGRENVYLNGAMMGFSRNEIGNMYGDIVSFAGLERFMDQKLKNYSSGMQVRLAFSMATRADADILLVDEVLAVGDEDFQRKCFDYFRELKKKHKTIVFVSHDMNRVREYCDRAILIENSKIVSRGSANEVSGHYSQMFRPKAVTVEGKKSDSRWGDGSIVFTGIKVSPDQLQSKREQLEIACELQANADLESVTVGFSITNDFGQILVGTNTKILQRSINTVREGENLKVVFLVPNIFTDGHYAVSVSATSESDLPYDWWEGVREFYSYEIRSTGLTVSPLVEADISRS